MSNNKNKNRVKPGLSKLLCQYLSNLERIAYNGRVKSTQPLEKVIVGLNKTLPDEVSFFRDDALYEDLKKVLVRLKLSDLEKLLENQVVEKLIS